MAAGALKSGAHGRWSSVCSGGAHDGWGSICSEGGHDI